MTLPVEANQLLVATTFFFFFNNRPHIPLLPQRRYIFTTKTMAYQDLQWNCQHEMAMQNHFVIDFLQKIIFVQDK